MRRTLSLDVPHSHERDSYKVKSNEITDSEERGGVVSGQDTNISEEHKTVLRTEYKATTNRMLRVAVNGFMESLGVVLGVMEELDVDVLAQSLESNQT